MVAVGAGFSRPERAESGPYNAQKQPAFEVASIRVDKSGREQSMAVNPGGIVFQRVTLRECLEAAYGVQHYQVAGPDWINSERYAISAKSPAQTDHAQLMRMLQTLLGDRFKLRIHRESKEFEFLMPPEHAKTSALRGEDLTGLVMDGLDPLGLKMEPQKAVLDIVVVDHAQKIPTEN